jgi:hypothetical protein
VSVAASRVAFAVEILGSLVVFTLVARWYWAPRLSRLTLADALTPLLLLHVARTVGLTMLVPGVVDPKLPGDFAVPAAYGDLLAAALALLSIAALRARWSLAPIVVWVFSVEGIGDLLNDFAQGGRIDLPHFSLGATWYIFTVLVPALLVTHVMIVTILVRPRSAPRPSDYVASPSSESL